MRILLIVMGVFLGLCVLCAIAGYFVGLPRVQDELESDIEEAIGTYVAPNIASIDGTPQPGTGTITEDELNAEIRAGDPNLDDLIVEITPAFIEFRFGEQSQELTYRAGVSSVDGRFEVIDPSLDGVPGWLLSEDVVTDGIEQGINNYLETNNLTLTSVTLGEGVMTFVTE
ncbi:MAG: hypothetical protein AB7V46_09715 [Thermomicrobiales bacterium]